jgi:hypothetical protein
MGPRAGLDTEVRGKILCLCQGLNPGHPVCNQTLLPEYVKMSWGVKLNIIRKTV